MNRKYGFTSLGLLLLCSLNYSKPETVKPNWLFLIDNGDNTATLNGIPNIIGDFQVILTANDGNLSVDQKFSIAVGTTVGIEDDILEKEFILYPNPATDFIDLKLPGNDAKQVTLLNLRGQVLKQFEAYENIRINVQDLKSGIYLISIQTDEFVITKRFMKVNK